jgi:predicted ester cyclase
VDRIHEGRGKAQDRDGVSQFFEMMWAAFPDLECMVERMIAEGDTVAVHTTMRGTHEGELMGVAVSGNAVEFAGIDIVRIADDRAVEHWGVTDSMAIMEQVGALSAEGAATA